MQTLIIEVPAKPDGHISRNIKNRLKRILHNFSPDQTHRMNWNGKYVIVENISKTVPWNKLKSSIESDQRFKVWLVKIENGQSSLVTFYRHPQKIRNGLTVAYELNC